MKTLSVHGEGRMVDGKDGWLKTGLKLVGSQLANKHKHGKSVV